MSADPLATSHCCYLLEGAGGATYVGYTVDPARRLRQHNGELAGGAKKTAAKRPWALVCVVSGFRTQASALRFEWRWQRAGSGRNDPRRSRAARLAALAAVAARGDGALAWPELAVAPAELGHLLRPNTP